MKNLIKFELSKLRVQKSFYICTVIMVILILLNTLAAVEMNEYAGMSDGFYKHMTSDSIIGAASDGAFDLLAGIAIAAFVCADYSQRTIGIVVGRGYDRTRVYFAKLIVVIIMSTVMYAVSLLSGTVFGVAFFDFPFEVMPNLRAQLPVQLISAIAMATLFFLISVTVKRRGASITLIIFVPMLVEIVLMVLDLFLPFKFYLSDLWISTIFTDLSILTAETGNLAFSLITSLLYAAAFVSAGWLMTRRNSF